LANFFVFIFLVGTWQSPAGQVEKAVTYALKDGYKMIDCAYCYGNEEEVGAGLKAAFEAGVKREDIFVVTKVWATYNTRPEQGLDKSLKALGLDYVDLFLVVSSYLADSSRVLTLINRSTGLFSSTPTAMTTSSLRRPTAPEMSSVTTTMLMAGSLWRSFQQLERLGASVSAT
jgi:diketogulonate reductase-like aldo/keto reductase